MYEVDFIGAGWAFPLGTDASGRVALVVKEREIEEAIRLILATARGAPDAAGVRLPDARSRLRTDQRGDRRAIAYDVRERWRRWEPRIDIIEVLVSFDRVSAGTLYIDIHYSIRGFNDPRNLVFPFYVIPEEPIRPRRRRRARRGDASTERSR